MKKKNLKTKLENFKDLKIKESSKVKGGAINSFMKVCGPDYNGGSSS